MNFRHFYLLAVGFVLSFVFTSSAQVLKAGFDADEYAGTLRRCAQQVGTTYRGKTPKEEAYQRVYRSPEMGMHNKYDLWLSADKQIMALNLRGTTSDMGSWIENFYSAMIPAAGSIKMTDSFTFQYKFAADPKAMVHTGWTLGVGSLAPDIEAHIMALYSKGTKQLIVEGHSQGGALAQLLTAYLRYRIADGKMPKDLVIKSYCSAAPKTGNLYFAYDFDFITRGGWAFTVVNAADWVPESPLSLQTIRDFNTVNPFTNARPVIKKQKFLLRLYLSHAYRQLTRNSNKAQRKYEKYLGRVMYTQVRKFMPQLQKLKYTGSANFMRAGTPVVLQPDAAYYQKFPDSGDNIFRHHLFEPYYYLVDKIYRQQ